MSHVIGLGFAFGSNDENLRWGFSTMDDHDKQFIDRVALLEVPENEGIYFEVYSLVNKEILPKEHIPPKLLVFQAAFLPRTNAQCESSSPFNWPNGTPRLTIDVADPEGISGQTNPDIGIKVESNELKAVGLGNIPADSAWRFGPFATENRGIYRMAFAVVAQSQVVDNEFTIYTVDPEMEVGQRPG